MSASSIRVESAIPERARRALASSSASTVVLILVLAMPQPYHGYATDAKRHARALEIARSQASLAHAREAVTREVRRGVALAERLPDGSPRDALIHLAHFVAQRCGAGA